MPGPSGPRSGAHGMIDGMWSLRNWTLNYIGTPAELRHSGTCSAVELVPGIEDWNFTCEGFGGYTGFFPGNVYASILYSGPNDGVCGNDGHTWEGFAYCENLTFTWAWQPIPIVSWTATFQGHGSLVEGEGFYKDEYPICRERICGIGLTYCDPCESGSEVHTTWNNIQGITLAFSNELQQIINSSTNCWVQREPGNTNWILDITDQEDYPVLNIWDIMGFRVYINTTEYWQLYWGMMRGINNIRVDIETKTIKSKNNNISMNGRVCCGQDYIECQEGNPSLGSITDPCGYVMWPNACCLATGA